MESSDLSAQRRGWTAAALIGSLTLVVFAYLPALSGDFLFDDMALLKTYDCWRGLDKVPAMFGFGEPNACTYRPVRYLTYALDYEIDVFVGFHDSSDGGMCRVVVCEIALEIDDFGAGIA